MLAARVSLILLVLASFPGCLDIPTDKYNQVQKQLVECQESNKKLESQLAEREASIRALQEQVVSLRKIGAQLDDLVTPARIELERLSGGYDQDGRAGDEGIVLYIQPVDRDGSIIKVAGTIQVRLFDLQNPPDKQALSVCEFDAARTRSLWFGRLMTNHFTVRCPFPNPPEHERITVEIVFTDLLTGRPLRAQGVYTVKLPPARHAAAER